MIDSTFRIETSVEIQNACQSKLMALDQLWGIEGTRKEVLSKEKFIW